MNTPKIIERAGERVLTTAQLAEAYETSKSTINTNFSRNKNAMWKVNISFSLLEKI